MFEIGEVVYHDNFVFNDGKAHDTKEKRPCIVLFTFNYGDRNIVCTCPLTSNIKSFNKHPDKYIFIPEVIYNERKLSFLNLENVFIHEGDSTHTTDLRVSNDVVNNIVSRFRNYNPKNKRLQAVYDDIIVILDYIELFDELVKRENKKEKKQKRRLARRKNG